MTWKPEKEKKQIRKEEEAKKKQWGLSPQLGSPTPIPFLDHFNFHFL